jgi:YggT family protein
MYSILSLIYIILHIVWWVIIASVVASWLVAFGVVNTRNRAVYTIVDTLNRLTEPMLRPIRRIVPQFGGLDISPMILLLLLTFLESLLHEYADPVALRGMYVR